MRAKVVIFILLVMILIGLSYEAYAAENVESYDKSIIGNTNKVSFQRLF